MSLFQVAPLSSCRPPQSFPKTVEPKISAILGPLWHLFVGGFAGYEQSVVSEDAEESTVDEDGEEVVRRGPGPGAQGGAWPRSWGESSGRMRGGCTWTLLEYREWVALAVEPATLTLTPPS